MNLTAISRQMLSIGQVSIVREISARFGCDRNTFELLTDACHEKRRSVRNA